jgi:hypothetical protein
MRLHTSADQRWGGAVQATFARFLWSRHARPRESHRQPDQNQASFVAEQNWDQRTPVSLEAQYLAAP